MSHYKIEEGKLGAVYQRPTVIPFRLRQHFTQSLSLLFSGGARFLTNIWSVNSLKFDALSVFPKAESCNFFPYSIRHTSGYAHEIRFLPMEIYAMASAQFFFIEIRSVVGVTFVIANRLAVSAVLIMFIYNII